MVDTLSVPLRSRKQQRGLLIQKLQHALPSIVLLGDGVTRVQEGHGQSLGLGVIEIAVAGTVIASVINGFRKLSKPTHSVVDWIDFTIGVMLFVEAYMHQHETGHWKRPTILLAVVMLVLSFAHHRLMEWGSKRRALRVDDDGVSFGQKFMRRKIIRWSEIASITVDADDARIATVDGGVKHFDLRDALNPDAVRAALLHADSHHKSLSD